MYSSPTIYLSRTVPQLWRPILGIHISVSCLLTVFLSGNWFHMHFWYELALHVFMSVNVDIIPNFQVTSDLHTVLWKLWRKTWHLLCAHQSLPKENPPPSPTLNRRVCAEASVLFPHDMFALRVRQIRENIKSLSCELRTSIKQCILFSCCVSGKT